MYPKPHEPVRADKILTLAPNVTVVSQNPPLHESEEHFFVFNDNGEYHGCRDVQSAALAMSSDLLKSSPKVVLVRARSLVDAEVLFKRNKGIAY